MKGIESASVISDCANERPELTRLLAYRNNDVVESFCDSLEVSSEKGEQIFLDLLRFLWLSTPTKNEKSLCVIDDPILVIDEMWHTFILYTRAYAQFCNKYFGRFIHHNPTTVATKRKALNKSDEARARGIRDKRERYSRIYDLLGQEVFVRWYHQYPTEFSRSRIREIRKK